jgi:peptidoglycan/xylan/chitin deacetylase (PgdA/CDA1 family)
MLLNFLYHDVNKEKYSNSLKILEKQFSYFSKKYNIVIPGDSLKPFKLNICLTFDDAYFSFYCFIFPLLKKLKIKALLAVPVKFIEDSFLKSKKTEKNKIYCTWKEIKEMSDSGLVSIASHSYSHKNLLEKNVDLEKEIVKSKLLIERKIKKEVNTFVYPFGKFNKKIHNLVKRNYRYIMRIGSSFNLGWNNMNDIIYRISSDNLKEIDEHLKFYKYFSYSWFYLLNTFRGR